MKIRTTTRKWGNSIAIVIPSQVVLKQRIKEDQSIVITIEEEKPQAGEFFGMFKGKFTEPTQKIKNEMRKGWESPSDRRRW